jgi:membrane protein DedA with SNARE-associated domain
VIHFLEHLLDTYGYAAIVVVIALENVGLPIPGETILVTSAIYAAETHRLHIIPIVLSAAAAAFGGGLAGFAIGEYGERRFLHRYGPYIHIDDKDLRLGRYLFERYGALVVFAARFIAFLRALAGLLAGVNRMDRRRFLLFNGLGAVVWASAFGFGAYALGRRIEALSVRADVLLAVLVVSVAIAASLFLHRNREWLQREADRRYSPR